MCVHLCIFAYVCLFTHWCITVYFLLKIGDSVSKMAGFPHTGAWPRSPASYLWRWCPRSWHMVLTPMDLPACSPCLTFCPCVLYPLSQPAKSNFSSTWKHKLIPDMQYRAVQVFVVAVL